MKMLCKNCWKVVESRLLRHETLEKPTETCPLCEGTNLTALPSRSMERRVNEQLKVKK